MAAVVPLATGSLHRQCGRKGLHVCHVRCILSHRHSGCLRLDLCHHPDLQGSRRYVFWLRDSLTSISSRQNINHPRTCLLVDYASNLYSLLYSHVILSFSDDIEISCAFSLEKTHWSRDTQHTEHVYLFQASFIDSLRAFETYCPLWHSTGFVCRCYVTVKIVCLITAYR